MMLKILRNKRSQDISILFCIAFLLRAIYVYQNKWLAGDSYDYLALAKNLIAFLTYGFGDAGSIQPSAFRPPLYSIFIAAFWWTDEAQTTVLYLQAVIGGATIVFVYLLAEKHFDRRSAFLAAILLSVEPFTIHYTASIMSETFFAFFLVLAVYLCGRKKYLLSGLSFGITVLIRGTTLPFLLVLLIFPFLRNRSAYRKPFLLVFFAAILTISPWTIRNAVIFKEFIPVSTTGYGYNFLTGTIDVPMLSDEGWDKVAGDPAIKQRFKDLESGISESQADRKLFKEALNRIAADPSNWLRVRTKQYIRLYIDSAPYIFGKNNIRIEDAWQGGHWFFLLFKVSFVSRIFVSVGLALIAIFLLRKRLSELNLIILFPVYLMLIHLPLWTENRYLLPMFPFTFILAAYAIVNLFDKLKKAWEFRSQTV